MVVRRQLRLVLEQFLCQLETIQMVSELDDVVNEVVPGRAEVFAAGERKVGRQR
jgi:hypothetical protein